jgi:hypothetical protein
MGFSNVAEETALDKAPIDQMAKQFGRRVAKSMAVVEVADRTHEVKREVIDVFDEKTGEIVSRRVELVRPAGMSDADWNIHNDAMKPMKDMPGYLVSHFNRVELAQKLAGARRDELPPIAGYVVMTVEKKAYETVNVEPTEKE